MQCPIVVPGIVRRGTLRVTVAGEHAHVSQSHDECDGQK
jgi:hypothetical protein